MLLDEETRRMLFIGRFSGLLKVIYHSSSCRVFPKLRQQTHFPFSFGSTTHCYLQLASSTSSSTTFLGWNTRSHCWSILCVCRMFSLHAFCQWMHVVREDGRNALFSGVPGTSHVIWYTCMYLIYFRENMSCCFFSRQRTRDGETEEFSSLRRTSTKGSWEWGRKGSVCFFFCYLVFPNIYFLERFNSK